MTNTTIELLPEKLVKPLILNTRGKVFTVWFTKKDGTIRQMNCRLGVKKGVKGTGKPLPPDSPMVRVFDMQADGFRTINTGTVLSIKCNGHNYSVTKPVNNIGE